MKTLLITCLLTASLALSAAAVSQIAKYQGYGHNRLAFNEQAKIASDKNYYDVNLIQSKPGKNGKQKTMINLSAPSQYWNFGRAPSDFLTLRVNGIPLSDIQPTPGSLKKWSDKDSAGVTFTLNFNGTKIFVNAYMKTGSPMLFLKFTQPEKQIIPIKGSFTVSLNMVISRLVVNEKKQTVWNGVYARQAQSATRLLKQQQEQFVIKADDQYLIFSDEKLDGTGVKDEKGIGPCLVAFDMKDGITGKLVMRNSYSTHLNFSIPANFKEFQCAIYQQKTRISNADFMKKFQEEKSAFTEMK